MIEVPTTSFKSLTGWVVNPHPVLGIAVSLGGFVASLFSVLAHISVVVGLIGAIFGCVAGYFTMRCQYHKWRNMK